MTLNKLILKTAGVTLLVLFVVTSYGFAMVMAISPQTMANLGTRLDARGMTAHAYYRLYRRDPSPQNLYLAINRMILANRYDQIIAHAPRLFASDQYDDIIAHVNRVLGQDANTLDNRIYSLVANEHDRLRTAYLRAHVMRRNFNEAIEVFWEEIDAFYDVWNDPEIFIYIDNPLAPIPDAQMENIKNILGRPTRTLLEIWELFGVNGFLVFQPTVLTMIENNFVAYLRDFDHLLWRVRGYHPTDSRIRVADGFLRLIQEM